MLEEYNQLIEEITEETNEMFKRRDAIEYFLNENNYNIIHREENSIIFKIHNVIGHIRLYNDIFTLTIPNITYIMNYI